MAISKSIIDQIVRRTNRQIVPHHLYPHEWLKVNNTRTHSGNRLIRIKSNGSSDRLTVFSNRYTNDGVTIIRVIKWLKTLHFSKKSLMCAAESGLEITSDNSVRPTVKLHVNPPVKPLWIWKWWTTVEIIQSTSLIHSRPTDYLSVRTMNHQSYITGWVSA